MTTRIILTEQDIKIAIAEYLQKSIVEIPTKIDPDDVYFKVTKGQRDDEIISASVGLKLK